MSLHACAACLVWLGWVFGGAGVTRGVIVLGGFFVWGEVLL